MAVRIGIMGFGRIGRNVFRILYSREDIEVAATVHIADPEALVYLLKFDHPKGPELDLWRPHDRDRLEKAA